MVVFLTLLEPQSRFGDKPVKFQVVCPQNGTAVLKGLCGEYGIDQRKQTWAAEVCRGLILPRGTIVDRTKYLVGK